MATEHQRIINTECLGIFDELKTLNNIQLARIDLLEKEVRHLKYTLIAVIIALRTILPNGLSDIISLFEKAF